MEYNESLFGAKQDVYKDSNSTQLYCSVASQNSTLSAGLKTGVYQINNNIDDSVFYWLVNSQSPYTRLSLINLITRGGVNTVNKVDTDAKNEHLPLVLTWQSFKINTNHDVDTTGTLPNSPKNTIPNGRFVQSMFKTQGDVDNPLLYNTNGLSESAKNNNFNKAPFVVDFDYNNIIATIQVGAGASSNVQDLANYNNTADNYISTISLAFYIGEIDDNNTTRVNSYIQQRYINGVNCGGSGNNGMTVVSDYRYKTPDVLRNEPFYYDTDEFNFFQAITTSVFTTALFNGMLASGANIYNVSYYMDDDHWELNDNNNGYRLKKHGNGVYNDDDFNYIRKCVAWLGFWFTDGGLYTDSEHSYNIYRHNTKLGNNANEYTDSYMIPNHVYQAEIKEGITTGNFTELRIAKDNDQSKWGKEWRKKNGYDGRTPGGGDKPKPTPDPNPIQLQTPGFSLAVDNGSVCYTINKEEWRRIWDDIYVNKKNFKHLIEGLSLYGSNPLNAILNYRWYPFEIAAGSSNQQPIRLGATVVKPESHTYQIIGSAAAALISSNIAEFWIGEDSNFIWTKKTKCRIFLPFYGYYELPMSQVMAKTVGVQFQYNLPDDTGVWAIYFDNHLYDYVECSPFIEIPITGDNSLQIAAAKAQRNLSIAMTVGTAVAGALVGGYAGLAKGVISSGFGTAADIAEQGVIGTIGALSRDAFYPQIGMAAGGALAGAAVPLAGGGIKTANTVMQSALQIGNLSTNVPVHSSGSDTTFLHLPMQPFIEFFTNNLIDGFNESQYKLKVGIACDMWKTTSAMPDDTLLAATGTADMDTSGMTLAEIQELNQILQSGFYK